MLHLHLDCPGMYIFSHVIQTVLIPARDSDYNARQTSSGGALPDLIPLQSLCVRTCVRALTAGEHGYSNTWLTI